MTNISIIPDRDSKGNILNYNAPFALAGDFRFRGQGFQGLALAGQTTNIDFAIPEERFINGVIIILNNHAIGDKAHFQVCDLDRVYEGIIYPVEAPDPVILDEFGKDWFFAHNTCHQHPVLLPYPARIYAGLYIRMVYESNGATDVDVMCNCFLHKKVVE